MVNPWYACPSIDVDMDVPNAVLKAGVLSLCGAAAGTGLCYFVQSTVSLQARKRLLVAGHMGTCFAWALSPVTCSPWTYLLIVVQLYLWGAEPYDNLLSSELWGMALHSWRSSGRWLDLYWAVSCGIVHWWFLLGAAWVVAAGFQPVWYYLALAGFGSSHMARICSYSHHDTVASLLEVVGLTCLSGCVAWSALEGDRWLEQAWLWVSWTERATHLPAAFRRDASWMRSYELWEAALHAYLSEVISKSEVQCDPYTPGVTRERNGSSQRFFDEGLGSLTYPYSVTEAQSAAGSSGTPAGADGVRHLEVELEAGTALCSSIARANKLRCMTNFD